jgi:tetratricopeptide (TPR) repeat protein
VSNGQKKTRRQLIDHARDAALSGHWHEAIEVNHQLLEKTPRDAEAQNRLGRAYVELNQYAKALESYTAALKIDPANLIARRNLQRLDLLRRTGHTDDQEATTTEEISSIPRPAAFIEEVGKTWVDELANPVSLEELSEVSPGEQLQLVTKDNRLVVTRADGMEIGEVEAKTAERVIELLEKGNRYEVYALGLSPRSLRVILREVYRDPSIAQTVSFPRQISATRVYLRERDLLRQRDESDFLFLGDDDDEDIEEETTGETVEDDETAADTDPYVEEAESEDEEGSSI